VNFGKACAVNEIYYYFLLQYIFCICASGEKLAHSEQRLIEDVRGKIMK
jgi:hypothetical protein